MKLAEIIRSIEGTEKSLGWVMWRYMPLLKSRLLDPEYQYEIQGEYRKVSGMVSARANLRRRVARTLRHHPEMVEALAERTVARIYAKALTRNSESRWIGRGDWAAQPDMAPALKARLEDARQRLQAADLAVVRLSAAIDMLSATGKPKKRRRGLPK